MTHRRRFAGLGFVNEVKWLLGRYNPDMLWMADDVFVPSSSRLDRRIRAALMKQRGIHIPFECITRADRLSERLVGLLAELGCMRVWIGSESGSQRILDAMERGVTVVQVRNAVALCKQAGIQTGMFLMWGYDGEEISVVEATIDHVKQCRPDIFFTTVSYPIKGTPYFNKVADRLVNSGQPGGRAPTATPPSGAATPAISTNTPMNYCAQRGRRGDGRCPDRCRARHRSPRSRIRSGGIAAMASELLRSACTADYDRTWTNTGVAGRLQRDAVWRHFASASVSRRRFCP